MNAFSRCALLMLLMAFSVTNTGCDGGSGVPAVSPAALTKTNYDKIVNDGSQGLDAAEAILGSKGRSLSPGEASAMGVRGIDGAQAYIWGDEKKNITVQVKDGKVWGKGMRNVMD